MMKQLKSKYSFLYRYRYEVLLLALFLCIYIIPLGARPLMVPDETRYAEIPREMLTSGNWVSPHLNGLRYFEKPALGYWVHAISLRLFGENNFAVRLPSALAVGLSALLLYILFRHFLFKEPDDSTKLQAHPTPSATLAPLIFLTCAEVFGVGNTAVLDNLLAFFLTATIITFFFATEASPGSMQEKKLLLLSGTACGLAFLTKGFLAFAVPVLSLGAYLLWQRRFRDLWRMSGLPLLAATLVALPWSILIHLKEPDFWNFFFWNEHIRRFLSDSAQHKKPFYFYMMATPGLIMPWFPVTPTAIAGVKAIFRKPDISGRLMRLAICWLVMPFLFFSCAGGKILTYILPCFPPFAILMAMGLVKGLEQKKWNKFFRWGAFANLLFFALLLLGFVVLQFFSFNGFRPYTSNRQLLLAIIALIFAIGFAWGSFACPQRERKIVLFALIPSLIFLSAGFLLPDLTIEKKAPGILLQRHLEEIDPDTIIISEKRAVRAVCWYLKRNNVYILGSGGELKYGLTYKSAKSRQLNLENATALIRQNPGKVLLVARSRIIKEWEIQLPQPVLQDSSGPSGYSLWRF